MYKTKDFNKRTWPETESQKKDWELKNHARGLAGLAPIPEPSNPYIEINNDGLIIFTTTPKK